MWDLPDDARAQLSYEHSYKRLRAPCVRKKESAAGILIVDGAQPTTSMQARQPGQYDVRSKRNPKFREKTRAARRMPTELCLLIYSIF